ncbi:hypothetical protein P152DRAFT_480049 [Eremomyces bilateralis CBS 781.70]|uniref:Nudix hydrolase domain-containing protein n=1 Tax=Eremomyces bilateralis CBS 781.70 TaxID=1392243 RepID=A0A6G1GA26_9PEZI|nr:uncharacterized protein P152DRAFT_480049 [Eremomyces bilateralis CBS 781.70]KAF1814928.1 hypothetical protein P152DRAFT_480049 [Eremomyces bilateralis CBS 781.70]
MNLPIMDNQKMSIYDWFDDLCVRFILNLPHEELSSVERICFQVEEAQWFYEDFVRPLDPSLPSMSLRTFCLKFFQHCPIFPDFSESHYLAAFTEFMAYKSRVPVRGAILLNEAMDHVVLVKGWKKGAKWSFPRGKINLGEKDLDCAIREVYEETGFDVHKAGLAKPESQMKFIEVSMREQHMRLYVFRGVKMDTHFEPRTRKEISKIDWYKISELPTIKRQKHMPPPNTQAAQVAQQIVAQEDMVKSNMFYMVAPFLSPLKSWIRQQKKLNANRTAMANTHESEPADEVDEHMPSDHPAAVESETLPQVVEQQSFTIKAASDMDRILTQLRQSHPNSQPPAAPIPPSDPAADLRRMLNMGQPRDSGPPLPSNSQASDLLALFNRQKLAGNTGPASLLPITPMEQISRTPDAQTPHHHHSQQHVLPTDPPPPHFHQPVTSVQELVPNMDPTQRPMPFPQPTGPRHPFIPDQVQRQMGAVPTLGPSLPIQSSSELQEAYSSYRPYRQTGDPQFNQSPDVHSPAIPSASKLPQPKLNSHTLALLNAFKGSSQPQAETERYVRSQEAHPSGSTYPPQNAPAPEPSASGQQQALLNLFKAGPGAGRPPQRSQLQGQSATLAPEPVELSAQPTPLVHQQRYAAPQGAPEREVLQQGNKKSQSITSATVSGPLNAPDFDTVRRSSSRRRPSHHAKPAELATVPSPVNEQHGQVPAPGPIKILARPSSRSVRPDAGITPLHSASPSPLQTFPSQQIPIAAPQPKAVHQHLQILRPPRAQPSVTSSPQDAASPPSTTPAVGASITDNRTPGASDQRNALLSLFTKHHAQAPPPGVAGAPIPGHSRTLSPASIKREPTASSLISPISPHLASMQPNLDSMSASRSRISSLASAPGESFLSTGPVNAPGAGLYGNPVQGMKLPPTNAAFGMGPADRVTSRKSSIMAGSRKGSAVEGPPRQQSPVTPIDRNFLLGYLEDVVKGAGV